MISYEEYIQSRVVNADKLEKLEKSLGVKIPRDMLKKAIQEHRAEEFMRQYYCKELQQSMTDLSSFGSEKVDGASVIKFDGQKFTMLVSALGAYSHGEEVSFVPEDGGSKTLATSLITDEFMGHYSRKNKELILVGYTVVPDDSLFLCGPQDLCSIHDDGTYEKRERTMGVNYMPARQMARQTSCYYNEYSMLRRNEKGEAILPSCVVSFGKELDDKTKSFAVKNNLPVVMIDWEKYKESQRQKLIDFQGKENPTPEELQDYLYGVVAYCSEFLCYDLVKQDVPFSDYLNKIKEKMNNVQEKFNVDENSKYHETCQNFVNFQQSTRNDAFGRIFANQIFKENSQSLGPNKS